MKTLLKSFFLCALLFTLQKAYSQSFEEGTHYSKIKSVENVSSNEVVEYFSFSCPGCYAIEPHIQAVEQKLPQVQLRRVHMPFGGPKAKFSQKAFVLLELFGAERHSDAIFSRIHLKRNLFDNDAEVIDFFVSLGYQQEKVSQALHSFSADTLLRKMTAEAIKMKINEVPTIIVNNQYKLNTRLIRSADDLTALIEYLNQLN